MEELTECKSWKYLATLSCHSKSENDKKSCLLTTEQQPMFQYRKNEIMLLTLLKDDR